MRFLIDENVPLMLAEALNHRGHDALHVARISPRANDPDVLARARQEGRILVTFDDDFARMIFVEGVEPPSALVYMRARQGGEASTISHFLSALDTGPVELRDNLVVIDQGGQVRVQPLR